MSSRFAGDQARFPSRKGGTTTNMENTDYLESLLPSAMREVNKVYEAAKANETKERFEMVIQSGATSLEQARETLSYYATTRKGEKGLTSKLFTQFWPMFEPFGLRKDKFNAYVQKVVANHVHPTRGPRKPRGMEEIDSDDEPVERRPKAQGSSTKPSDESWRAPKIDYASSVGDLIPHGNTVIAREMNMYYAKYPQEVENLNKLMRANGRNYTPGSLDYPPDGATSIQRKIYRRMIGAVPIQGRLSMANGDDVLTGKAYAGRISVHPCLLFVAVTLRVFGVDTQVKLLNETCGGLPFQVYGTNGQSDIFIIDPAEKVRKIDGSVSGRVLNLVAASAVYASVEEAKKEFYTLFKARANRWRQIMATAACISDERAANFVPVRSFEGRMTTMVRKMDEYYDEFCNSSNYALSVRINGPIIGTSAYPAELWSMAESTYSERRAATLPVDLNVTFDPYDTADTAAGLMYKLAGSQRISLRCQTADMCDICVSNFYIPEGIVSPQTWREWIPEGFLDMDFGVFHTAACHGLPILKTYVGTFRVLGRDSTVLYDITLRNTLRRYTERFGEVQREVQMRSHTKDRVPDAGRERGIQFAELDAESSVGGSDGVSIAPSQLSVSVRTSDGSDSFLLSVKRDARSTRSATSSSVTEPSPGVKLEVQPLTKTKADKTKATRTKVNADVSVSKTPTQTGLSMASKDNDNAAGVGKPVTNPVGDGIGKPISNPKDESHDEGGDPQHPEDDPPSDEDWEKILAVVLAMRLKVVSSQGGIERVHKGAYSYVPVYSENMAYSVSESFWYPAPDFWRKEGRPAQFAVEYKTKQGKLEVPRVVVYYYMYHRGVVKWSTQTHLSPYEGKYGYVRWRDYSRAASGLHYNSDNRTFDEHRVIDRRQILAVFSQAEKLMEAKIPTVMQGVRDDQIDKMTKSLYADTVGENNVFPYYGQMVGDGNYVIRSGDTYYHVSDKHGWRRWIPVNSAITSWFNFQDTMVASIAVHYSANFVLVKNVSTVHATQRPWHEIPLEGNIAICLPVSFVTTLEQVVKTNAPSQTTSSRILAALATLKLPSEYSGLISEHLLKLMSDYIRKETASMSDHLNRINFHASLHSLALQDTQSFAKWTYPYLRSNPLSVSTVAVLIQVLLPWLLTSMMGWQGVGYGVSHHSFSQLITLSDYLHVLHDASYWTLMLVTIVMVWAALGEFLARKPLTITLLQRPDIFTRYTSLVAWADNLCWQAGLLARLIWIPCLFWFLCRPVRPVKDERPPVHPEERMAATLPSTLVQFSAWCFPTFKNSQKRMRLASYIKVKNMTQLGDDGIMDESKWAKLEKARPITHPGPIIHSMIEAYPNFVLAQTPWNTLRALRERALRYRGQIAWWCAEQIAQVYGILPRVDVEPPSRADIDVWLRNRQAKYKEKYARVLAHLASHGFQYTKQDFEVGVFVKEETLPKLSPRIICTMSENFNAYFGPWCMLFERKITQVVADTGYAIFTGGLNPSAKGQWYYDNIYQGNMWVLDIDASKWDASVPDELIDQFYNFLIACGWSDKKFLDHRRNFVIKKRFSNGATIKAHIGGRFITSGAPDTYIGNSVMNLMLQFWVMRTICDSDARARECRFMICGDDAIVGIPKHYFPNVNLLRGRIQAALDATGMEFEINLVDSKDTHDFKYCSGFFAPSMDSQGRFSLVHVPEPVRFLGKSYAYRPEVMETISLDEHRRAVNLCGFYSYCRDPVWSNVFIRRFCLTEAEPIVQAMRTSVGSVKWRELTASISSNIQEQRWPEEVVAASWRFWQRIYPELNPINLQELLKFVFREELGLTKPGRYGFYSLSEEMSAVLTRGLYPVASFHESLRTKLVKPEADGDPRAYNPFAFVVVCEEMDTAINRLMRSEVENEQFRMAGPSRMGDLPRLVYDTEGRNMLPMVDRVKQHVLWNRGTRTWTQALQGGLLDSFYMREMWDNPELAARVQWWQGEEVSIPILRK